MTLPGYLGMSISSGSPSFPREEKRELDAVLSLSEGGGIVQPFSFPLFLQEERD